MIGEMQFTAVMLLTLLALALAVMLPKKLAADAVTNRSRWLMVAGLLVLALQFLLQYILGLRQMGVTQAAMLNIVLFIPCSALLSLSVLNLQRQGRVQRSEWYVVLPTWLLSTGLIAWGAFTDGKPLLVSTDRLLWAEVASSCIYAAMQLFFSVKHIREVRRMQLALDSYYDHERRGLLDWLRVSIVVLSLLSLSVPVLIFASGLPLAFYGLFFFGGIFYLWFMFVRYVLTQSALRVREAEQSAEEEEKEKLKNRNEKFASPEVMQQVSHAVELWLNAGGHLHSGITSSDAAREMNVPRYQLTTWVKASGHESFTRWITTLRINEAKRLLREHPDWSNEAVADHCGFTRTYFQQTFKKETGLSPAEYLLRS